MAEKTGNIVVSVIMPAYNEEERIEICFKKVFETMQKYGQPFEVILEEDGSTDKTARIMDKIAENHHNVKVLHFPRRIGKGFGIRKCFEAARGDYIVLIDSDMEYPPERIPDLLNGIDGHDIIVGKRSIWKNRNGKKIKLVRALMSRAYSRLIQKVFSVTLDDYQSGFKAFRRRVIKAIQPLKSNGFEIDSEILIKAQRKGFKIGFVPVTYTYKGNSKVNIFHDSIKMFISILKWKANGQLKT